MIPGDSPSNRPEHNSRKRSCPQPASEGQESQPEGKRVKRSAKEDASSRVGKDQAENPDATSIRHRKTSSVQAPFEAMETSSVSSSESRVSSSEATPKKARDPICLFSSIDSFAELQSLSRRLKTSIRVEPGISTEIPHDPSLSDEEKPRGAFAKRPFVAGEIISFYLGQVIRRRKLTGALKKYLPASMVDKYQDAYFVWHEAGPHSTSRYNDSHTAWTGVKLIGTGIELGVDGMAGGNDLRYLNHSFSPNTDVKTVVNEEHLADTPRAKARMLLDPEKAGEGSLLTVVVANRDILRGEELTMDYQDVNPEQPDPFAHVGKNILGGFTRWGFVTPS